MEQQKRKCVILGIVIFMVIAALVGVLCGIFIPKLIQSNRNRPVIVRPNYEGDEAISTLSPKLETNSDIYIEPTIKTTLTTSTASTTTKTTTTTAPTTTSATTTTTTTTTTTEFTTTTTLPPAIPAGEPLLEYLASDMDQVKTVDLNITLDGDFTRMYVVNLTTGTWMINDVDKPIWTHHLVIVVPKFRDEKLDGNAFLYSTEGPSDGADLLTSYEAEFVRKISEKTGSVTALLYGNPMGPMTFYHNSTTKGDDLFGRQLLAYSWDLTRQNPTKYTNNIIFPIIRSVIRSMDAISEYVSDITEGMKIDKFCVMTEVPFVAWMSGVDKRVKCSIPIIADMINATATLESQYRSMAAWSHPWAGFGNIFDALGSRAVHELFRHVDPVFQPYRFNQTIYMLRAGNDDQFPAPDSTINFYNKMSEYQKIYIRTLPNALHEVDDRFLSGVIGFYVSSQSLNLESNRNPTLNWTMINDEMGNYIVVDSDRKPTRVTVWMAESQVRNKRDFRLLKLSGKGIIPQNAQYRPFVEPPYLKDMSMFYKKRRRRESDWWNPNYTYRASFSQPEDGYWKAYFIEMEFIGPHGHKLIYTTETNVIPNRIPWNGCWSNQRKKYLYDCTKSYQRRFI